MVYFTCGACGEQVKKPQVEKHYTQKCRSCNVLTCIDCLKDFYGEEYKTHNQCMSEAQRYSKEGREGWDPTQGQGNKGDKKQQEWMDKLRHLLDSSSSLEPAVRNIITTIENHDNIPRKRPKFINFVKNIMRNKASMSDIEKTWDLFSQAQQQSSPKEQEKSKPEPMESESTQESTKTEENSTEKKKKKKTKEKENVESSLQNGDKVEDSLKVKKKKTKEEVLQPHVEEPETKKEKKKKKKKGKENENVEEAMETTNTEETKKEKKGKKRKMEETLEESKSDLNGTADDSTMEVDGDGAPAAKKAKFDWDSVITQVLSKKGNKMKLKKLKKKCVSEFFVQNPQAHQTPEQIGTKFDKKINKRQKYKIVGEEVSLNTREDNNNQEEDETTNCDNKKSSGKSEAKSVNGDHKSSAATNGAEMNGKSKGLSWNAWEAASLGNDAQTEKFRRLMGIKTDVKPQDLSGVKKRDDRKIFRDLEHGFEKARDSHFRAKGMGLGFHE